MSPPGMCTELLCLSKYIISHKGEGVVEYVIYHDGTMIWFPHCINLSRINYIITEPWCIYSYQL